MSAQTSIAEQIFILVKKMPLQAQQSVLSEVKKMELIYRAQQADAAVSKDLPLLTEQELAHEISIVRKQHYERRQ